MQELLKKINSLPFTKTILNKGGMVYAIGGVVRDFLLKKESKDLDILVTKIEADDLLNLLKETGDCQLVGESFGIIKYKQFGSNEDIDISLPRKEIFNGERGHKAFDVTTNPFMDIEEDLIRRDITINSMALDIHGNITDPYNGLEDLRDKVIRATNNITFVEDILRCLRAVGFASRFNFTIAPDTLKLIQDNAHRINEISPERILIELEKIVDKGSPEIGADLLFETGLYKHIFKSETLINKYKCSFKVVTTLGEFIFLLKENDASKFFKEDLKGDIYTYKNIKALEIINDRLLVHDSSLNIKLVIFKAINIFPQIVETPTVKYDLIYTLLQYFRNGKYPKSLKELNVDGYLLQAAGFKGTEIGIVFNKILEAVFNDEIQNDKDEIIKFIYNEKDNRIKSSNS